LPETPVDIGALLKNKNLGPMLNTVLGLVGGGVGGKLLPMLVPAIGASSAAPTTWLAPAACRRSCGMPPVIASFLKKPAQA